MKLKSANSQETILEQIAALEAKIDEKEQKYTTLNEIYK